MSAPRATYSPAPAPTPLAEQVFSEEALQLFSDVSHAFQTPLTVLKSSLELLQENPEQHKANIMQSMEQSVDALSHLTRNLLQLARIESPEFGDSFTTVNFTNLLTNTLEYVRVICDHHHIALEEFIDTEIYVFGNEEQLREAITNLLSNAIKYTSGGKIRKISVSLTHSRKQCTLSVADTGVGIPPDRVPYIFSRFYRDRRGTAPGSGLGLTIVKSIMEKHRGTIEVESSIGKGTCFIVQLPCV